MKLVLIDWVDSRGVNTNWHHLTDFPKDNICNMKSVGWLLHDDDGSVCIVPHVGVEDSGDNQGCGEMNIPKACITKLTVLAVGEINV